MESQVLTVFLRLRNANKRGLSMTELPKNQQAFERVGCRYLYLTNRHMQLTTVVELGRLKESKEKGDLVGGPAVSIYLYSQDLSNTGQPRRQHIPDDMRHQTHIEYWTAMSVFIQR